MALRRKGSAPLTEFEVLAERLAALENEVKQLRQPGASSIQSDRFDQTVDPPPWGMMLHWPGMHVTATPYSNLIYYHPGYVDPITGEEVEAGWKQVSPPATHACKVFADNRLNKIRTGAFKFDVEEDLADRKIVAVAAFNGTPGAGVTTVQIVNMTRGITILTTPITIDSNEHNSYTAATPPQIDTTGVALDPNNKVHLGDAIWINVTSIGTNSMGLGVYITFA